ncbi:MAG: DinB family protein [Actinomycetota bacterium]|nr:DinB family protein [Actinomycetota bacterium]
MQAKRIEPSTTAAERDMLEEWLDYHRATLEMKCEGLSPEQLRLRTVSPSSLTLLGLVRHMAEVERYWFRNIFRGEDAPPLYFTDEDPDGDFNDLESAEPESVFTTWRAECAYARDVSKGASLDDVGRQKSKRTGEEFSLRWILVHMIEEYARHNGHADLIREATDGATGD